MKKTVLYLLVGLLIPVSSIAQTQIDTLYYDKDGRGVEDKIFASYYRVTAVSSDPTYPKKCWTYYMTGERLGETNFISIDRADDSKSVFDGEYTTYYKSGNISEHGYRTEGVFDGECYALDENGDVTMHATYKNGQLDGPYLEYDEDKQVYIKTEFDNGSYVNDYYIVSTKDGYYSRFRLSNDEPLYDTPSIDDKITQYVDAVEWQYYNMNGILLALTTNNIKYYGKYVQLDVTLSNYSLLPFDFSTENFSAEYVDDTGVTCDMEVVSYDDFMRKVKRVNTFDKVAAGINAGMSAINAGMSSTSTTTSTTTITGTANSSASATAYSGGTTAYGSAYGTTNYRGTTTTTTTTYDRAYAEEKGREAGEELNRAIAAADAQKDSFDREYLKKTTLYPGDTMGGKVNLPYTGATSVTVYVTIGSAVYEFPLTIDFKKNKKNYTWD